MQQVFPHDENPPPENTVVHSVLTADGVELRALTASVSEPRGTVIFLNGRAEYLERYFETMRDAQTRGFSVASLDWRGQGGSQRQLTDRMRGYVRRFSEYDEDLRSFMNQVVLKHCPKPYYVVAHSTGGQIVLRALRHRTAFSKGVMTSPLIGLRFGWWPKPVVRLINTLTQVLHLTWMYLPGYSTAPLKAEDFSRNVLTSDQKRWDRDIRTLREHPELAIGGVTYGWLIAAMASVNELKRWPRGQPVSCPTLMIAAGREALVDARAARYFSQRVQGISFMQIEGAKHEILMEQDTLRKPFWGAFDAFIGVKTD
jgi:lysophospholipase